MAELLKNLYNQTFFEKLNPILSRHIEGFEGEDFMNRIFDEEWKKRELKDRMKQIAKVLHHFLPDNYPDAVTLILSVVRDIEQSELSEMRLEGMFFPEYVEKFGIHDFETSVMAMEQITKFASCEFAVRPYIKKYPEKMMEQILEWTLNENHHVRRLASEGCRPRLPWAMALPVFKKNPFPVLTVLERLKEDPSEYVRRSVANNLNDIAKDHPELVLEIGMKWMGIANETDWIVKHGCRTLLKNAHPGSLKLFGFEEPDEIEVTNLQVQSVISIGEKLDFSFSLKNKSDKSEKIRLEYAIDYVKSNGSRNRKIFKITENWYASGDESAFARSQSFREMTTRKHYPGLHRLAVIVNGQEMDTREFEVKLPKHS
jgi:3-methyladenine DNA glycosylase AlkC